MKYSPFVLFCFCFNTFCPPKRQITDIDSVDLHMTPKTMSSNSSINSDINQSKKPHEQKSLNSLAFKKRTVHCFNQINQETDENTSTSIQATNEKMESSANTNSSTNDPSTFCIDDTDQTLAMSELTEYTKENRLYSIESINQKTNENTPEIASAISIVKIHKAMLYKRMIKPIPFGSIGIKRITKLKSQLIYSENLRPIKQHINTIFLTPASVSDYPAERVFFTLSPDVVDDFVDIEDHGFNELCFAQLFLPHNFEIFSTIKKDLITKTLKENAPEAEKNKKRYFVLLKPVNGELKDDRLYFTFNSPDESNVRKMLFLLPHKIVSEDINFLALKTFNHLKFYFLFAVVFFQLGMLSYVTYHIYGIISNYL